jgi:hypothetical protein
MNWYYEQLLFGLRTTENAERKRSGFMQKNAKIGANQLDEHDDLSSPIEITNTQTSISDLQDIEKEKASVSESQTPLALIQAAVEIGLIIGGLLYIYLLLPRSTGGDGWFRYQDLLSLLAGHKPPSKYSLIGPLFAYPLLRIGNKLGRGYQWISAYNFVLFCCVLLVTYFLLRNRMDRSLLRKFFLILVVASMFPVHLGFFYGEVFTALCVGMGILIVYARYKRFVTSIGWIAIILGVANTPATILGLAFMMLKKSFDSKRLRYLFIVVVVLACIMTESFIRFGSFLGNGYGSDAGLKTIMPYSGLPGFSYPFFFGLLSILFSFGKGIVFFIPALFLPIRKVLLKRQQEYKVNLYQVYTLWISFVIGLVMVYARWWAWHGALFWGPRFFLIACLPASLVLAVRLRYRKDFSLLANVLTLFILGLSIWISIDGAVFQWADSINLPNVCTASNYRYEMICYYAPEFSALWYPFVTHISLTKEQLLFMAYSVVAGLYLAAPLLAQIGQQTKSLINKYYSYVYPYLKLWRI